MTKDVGILILGLIVVATPFLGLPGSWKTVVFVVSGLTIAFLAFLLRGDLPLPGGGGYADGGRKTDTFAENGSTRAQELVGDGIKKISGDNPHEVKLKAEGEK